MKKAITILLAIVFMVYTQMFTDDSYISRLYHERLKNSMNNACHDASLQVDQNQILQGNIVFDRVQALQAFKKTLAANLGINNDLSPTNTSFLKDQIKVVFQDYIDENSGVTFPYHYINPQYKIDRVMEGPSVVYAIQVKYPQYNRFVPNYEMFKTAVYEYPFPH